MFDQSMVLVIKNHALRDTELYCTANFELREDELKFKPNKCFH